MKRFLMLAGFALLLPACVHANDFHRVLTETQLEMRRSETLSDAARSTGSDALLDRFAALEDAVKGDPVLLEKTQRLHALARFQLIHGGRIGTLDLPPPVPTYRQPGAAGESCDSPLPLNTGEALELQMQPGESLWIRVQGSTEKAVGVTTRGSRLDTRLSAWPDCRELVADPIASADDSIGLQAELTLPTDKQTFWLVRLDNLGDQSGTVILGGVDFSLVQGSVTRSTGGTPVSNATVGMFRVVDGQYWIEGTTQVDAQGRYLIGYQQSGAYAFRTGNVWPTDPLGHEAWRDTPCASRFENSMFDCTLGQAQPTQIALNGGSATLDFALDSLGEVTGLVTDVATGAPLASTHIRLGINQHPDLGASTFTDATGRFRIGLTSGVDSYLIAEAMGYRSQLYNGIDCPQQSCNLSSGTPVRNNPASPVLRADFALSPAPRLDVEVRIGGALAPQSEFFTLTLFDPAGTAVYAHSFYGSRFSLEDLAAGSYRVRIESNRAYSQLHGFYPDSADTFRKAHSELKECPCRSASVTPRSTSGRSSSWCGDRSRVAARWLWRSGSTRTC
ncbi:MSCRAMM family protein [Aquimonas voraii]|uniref:Carboxypeptidase regulatory-like domain-containing protein n=1 Tax=Aquimonas voraii TaxID=265719 RepID=A0A1G6TAC3_9GAMM|nr:carboxypeptidase-like regulatory domain-containing protein [Aquimonas voraii]SDD25275.1 Carboxypeptidase regulatory-like domain-containing protein [Aquimonas voraii]